MAQELTVKVFEPNELEVERELKSNLLNGFCKLNVIKSRQKKNMSSCMFLHENGNSDLGLSNEIERVWEHKTKKKKTDIHTQTVGWINIDGKIQVKMQIKLIPLGIKCFTELNTFNQVFECISEE